MKRKHIVKAYVSIKDFDYLQKASKSSRLSISSYVRKLSLDTKIEPHANHKERAKIVEHAGTINDQGRQLKKALDAQDESKINRVVGQIKETLGDLQSSISAYNT